MRGGKIYGIGHNGFSGGRKLTESTRTTHAEIDVLRQIRNYKGRKRNNLIVINVNMSKDGTTLKNSKPCTHCCHSLLDNGIRTAIYYDNSRGWCREDLIEIVQKSKLSSGDIRECVPCRPVPMV